MPLQIYLGNRAMETKSCLQSIIVRGLSARLLSRAFLSFFLLSINLESAAGIDHLLYGGALRLNPQEGKTLS
jgi:hypothetical protein